MDLIKVMYRSPLFYLLIFFLFFTAGCADKQWRDPLGDNEETAVRRLLLEEQQKKADCSASIDAELLTTWSSQLHNGSINGYIQILLPSSVKIVALNPLGQPLFAFATDTKTFQTINAVKGVYKHGRLATFVQRYGIPEHILDGNWGQWLTGTFVFADDQLIELHQDISARGVWLTVENNPPLSSKEHILYDPIRKQLLQRIILDSDGDDVASIDYTGWQDNRTCALPTHLQIKGISFGATISLEMKDIVTDNTFSKETFFLKLPQGYTRQYYP